MFINRKIMKKLLEYWDKCYYEDNFSPVPDEVYDKIKAMVGKDDVGKLTSSILPKVKHSKPMLSLQNAFNLNDVQKFIDRTATSHSWDNEYTIELKVDGLSFSAVYHEGELVLGCTRGDGIIGENVTENLKTILPNNIQGVKGSFEIRGEIFMRHSTFELFKGEFKNSRNAASGSLRQLNPEITKQRKLSYVAYDLLRENRMFSQKEKLEVLKNLGFCVEEHTEVFYQRSLGNSIEEFLEKPENLDFPVDGLVIKVSNHSKQTKLGYTSTHPRWAIAYKFPTQEYYTNLESVSWEVGRTGHITPLGHVKPVLIDGTTVSKASLHNEEFIEKNQLRIGSAVSIVKAGEIIPYIVGLDKTQPEDTKPITIPTTCPSCYSKLKKKGAFLVCKNHFGCPEQMSHKVHYFFSTLKVDGIGIEASRKLVEHYGFFDTINKTLRSSPEDLQQAGLGKVNSDKIYQRINEMLQIEQERSRFLCALGISGVGISVAKDICKNNPDLMNINDTKYLSINVQKSIKEIQKDSKFQNELYLLLKLFKFKPEQPLKTKGTVVITGTFSQPRKELEQLIQDKGYAVSSSVSKNTSILLAGEKAGSKLEKAKKLGIKIINDVNLIV